MLPKSSGIRDVAERQLCCGCGACAYAAPESVAMVDDVDHGRRPIVLLSLVDSRAERDAMAMCPGHALDSPALPPEADADVFAGWGPVLQVWEGWAGDPDVRFAGSSGGAATALALHCMAAEGMHGTLHIAARKDVPYLNHTVLSTTYEQMLAATGSRYAPASPCDGLSLVEQAPAPCVFIGKPCDVAATTTARRLRPQLDRKLGLTIAVFCAGTPSTRGTLEMLRVMGVSDPATVGRVRYRGNGWPGKATAWFTEAGTERTSTLTYEQSWGHILQKHRQWRCHVCVDHTGEFADVAVGDPWYEPPTEGEPGRSLVVARTERGRSVVEAAIASGALVLTPVEASLIEASQPNLLRTRGAVAGRVVTSRLLGAAAPNYRGFSTWRFWWRVLTLREKMQSLVGTARRVRRKGLRRRIPVTALAEQVHVTAPRKSLSDGAR